VSQPVGKRLYEIFFKTITEEGVGSPCTRFGRVGGPAHSGLSLARPSCRRLALNRRTRGSRVSFRVPVPRLGPGQIGRRAATASSPRAIRCCCSTTWTAADAGRPRCQRSARTALAPGSSSRPCPLDDTNPVLVRALSRRCRRRCARHPRDCGTGFSRRGPDSREGSSLPDQLAVIHSPGSRLPYSELQQLERCHGARAGHDVSGMEYFCFKGDGLWKSDDADSWRWRLQSSSCSDSRTGKDVVDGTVILCRRRIRIYDSSIGSTSTSYARPFSALQTCTGRRNGMHKYNNQDHSMLGDTSRR